MIFANRTYVHSDLLPAVFTLQPSTTALARVQPATPIVAQLNTLYAQQFAAEHKEIRRQKRRRWLAENLGWLAVAAMGSITALVSIAW